MRSESGSAFCRKPTSAPRCGPREAAGALALEATVNGAVNGEPCRPKSLSIQYLFPTTTGLRSRRPEVRILSGVPLQAVPCRNWHLLSPLRKRARERGNWEDCPAMTGRGSGRCNGGCKRKREEIAYLRDEETRGRAAVPPRETRSVRISSSCTTAGTRQWAALRLRSLPDLPTNVTETGRSAGPGSRRPGGDASDLSKER